ncbi:hypothetical protein GH714_044127 [Hevea brasiliensis]|uniref:Uncharacterized protein n=1 Tax=Hevea brasiliensis TaxID=3981 RepID=A0A6A6K1T6_HEVBR|nr:hypothetical protein GH714_044127 [Hevea brasiliensis]
MSEHRFWFCYARTKLDLETAYRLVKRRVTMSEASVLAAYKRNWPLTLKARWISHVEITHVIALEAIPVCCRTSDLTATLETGETVTFEATPMGVAEGGNTNDTDQQASFTLPDVGICLTMRFPNSARHILMRRCSRSALFVITDLSYPSRGPVTHRNCWHHVINVRADAGWRHHFRRSFTPAAANDMFLSGQHQTARAYSGLRPQDLDAVLMGCRHGGRIVLAFRVYYKGYISPVNARRKWLN